MAITPKAFLKWGLSVMCAGAMKTYQAGELLLPGATILLEVAGRPAGEAPERTTVSDDQVGFIIFGASTKF